MILNPTDGIADDRYRVAAGSEHERAVPKGFLSGFAQFRNFPRVPVISQDTSAGTSARVLAQIIVAQPGFAAGAARDQEFP